MLSSRRTAAGRKSRIGFFGAALSGDRAQAGRTSAKTEPHLVEGVSRPTKCTGSPTPPTPSLRLTGLRELSSAGRKGRRFLVDSNSRAVFDLYARQIAPARRAGRCDAIVAYRLRCNASQRGTADRQPQPRALACPATRHASAACPASGRRTGQRDAGQMDADGIADQGDVVDHLRSRADDVASWRYGGDLTDRHLGQSQSHGYADQATHRRNRSVTPKCRLPAHGGLKQGYARSATHDVSPFRQLENADLPSRDHGDRTGSCRQSKLAAVFRRGS